MYSILLLTFAFFAAFSEIKAQSLCTFSLVSSTFNPPFNVVGGKNLLKVVARTAHETHCEEVCRVRSMSNGCVAYTQIEHEDGKYGKCYLYRAMPTGSILSGGTQKLYARQCIDPDGAVTAGTTTTTTSTTSTAAMVSTTTTTTTTTTAGTPTTVATTTTMTTTTTPPIYGETVNDVYTVARNIRYAMPPIGGLRFQAPVGMGPYNGVYDNGKPAIKCPSLRSFNPDDNLEDCLYLNVFAPKVDQLNFNAHPVLVMVHGGGGFEDGSASDFNTDGILNNLVSKGIIVITFNYRLGPFGWWSLNGPEALGNWALMDQILVLQWVKDNIRKFNGDPDKVTLLGVSDGSICAAILNHSPLAKGLFSQAIFMGGTMFSPWGWRQAGMQNIFSMFVSDLNCNYTYSAQTVACMKYKPVDDIVMEAAKYSQLFDRPVWGPTVDNFVFTPHNFIKVADRVIVGEARAAYGVFEYSNPTASGDQLKQRINDLLSPLHGFKNVDVLRTIVHTFAIGNTEAFQDIYGTSKPLQWAQINMQMNTEILFTLPVAWQAQMLLSLGTTVYLYSFEYFSYDLHHQFGGAFHGADMMHLLASDWRRPVLGNLEAVDVYSFNKSNSQNHQVATLISDSFAAFVKWGNPSTSSAFWPELTLDGMEYLPIDAGPVSASHGYHHKNNMHVWQGMILKLSSQDLCAV